MSDDKSNLIKIIEKQKEMIDEMAALIKKQAKVIDLEKKGFDELELTFWSAVESQPNKTLIIDEQSCRSAASSNEGRKKFFDVENSRLIYSVGNQIDARKLN